MNAKRPRILGQARCAMLLCSALAGTALAGSCSHTIDGDSGETSGTASLEVGVSIARQKTVTADLVALIASFDVAVVREGTIVASGTASAGVEGSVSIAGIAPGDCTIEVNAKSSSGALVAEGSADATLATNGSQSVTVPLSLACERTGSTGAMSLAMTWPTSTGLAYVRATLDGADIAAPEVTAGTTDYAATLSASSLAGGTHLLYIYFMASSSATSSIGPYVERVNVWDGVTSTKWVDPRGNLADRRSFSASEFASSNAALAGLGLTGASLSIDFDPETTSYSLKGLSGSSFSFATTEDLGTQNVAYTWNGLEGTWASVVGATFTSPGLTLVNGVNTLKVVVTAPDKQTTRTYAIGVSCGDLALGVNLPSTDYLGLEFPKAVTILQGQPFAAETGNPTLDAIANGWSWDLDGAEQASQTGPRFVLSMATTGSMVGTYQIAASVKSGSGVIYSGRFPLTVLRRPGSWGSDTLSMDSSNADITTSNATGVTFDRPYSLVKVGTYLYVANMYKNNIVRIDLTTGAGIYFAGSTASLTGTTDAQGTNALFKLPRSITSDGVNLYVGEEGNNQIRKIVIATAQVSTLADTGGFASNPTTSYYFNGPNGIATDGTYLYAMTTYSDPRTIQKVTIATGVAETLLSSAEMNYPLGMATDGTNLYVADRGTYVIHKVAIANGRMTTLAGSSGNAGYADGAGETAMFNLPRDVTTDGTNVFVADSGNNRIRRIVISTGVVSTIAGSGEAGTNDAVGLAASFSNPGAITCDGSCIYVADTSNNRIRAIAKQ